MSLMKHEISIMEVQKTKTKFEMKSFLQLPKLINKHRDLKAWPESYDSKETKDGYSITSQDKIIL